MFDSDKVSTGIEGLDRIIQYLRVGDNVAWQIDSLADYMYVANRFVMGIARAGKRIVYIRFGNHEEVVDADGLAASGANVKKYELDPHIGFETFSVQVHRIINGEGKGVFFIFDCISELQKFWFSDNMVANFVCLTTPFIAQQGSIAYMMKNPGGGIAVTGAYCAGRSDLINDVAERLTAPMSAVTYMTALSGNTVVTASTQPAFSTSSSFRIISQTKLSSPGFLKSPTMLPWGGFLPFARYSL